MSNSSRSSSTNASTASIATTESAVDSSIGSFSTAPSSSLNSAKFYIGAAHRQGKQVCLVDSGSFFLFISISTPVFERFHTFFKDFFSASSFRCHADENDKLFLYTV